MTTTTTRRKRTTTPKSAADPVDAEVIDLAQHRPPADDRVVVEIPLEEIEPDADNVRQALRDLEGLAGSIKTLGVLEPCLVTRTTKPGRWRLVAGHRRRAAAQLAGLATLPCLEQDLGAHPDSTRTLLQLIENLQRDDLTPLEEARGYQTLIDHGSSQRRLAAQVGKNQSHISKRLKLLTLPPKVGAKVDNGELSIEDGLELARLAEHPEHLAQAIADHAKDAKDAARWGGDPDPMADYVTQQLRGIENQARRLDALAELDTAGIRVVDWPGNHGTSGWPKGHRRLDATWQWPDSKAPTKARVEKAGKLAAAVDETGGIVWLCTDAAAFETTPKKSTAGAPADDAAARRALNKRKRADAARRITLAGEHVRTMPKAADRDAQLAKLIGGDPKLGEPIVLWLRSVLATWLDLVGYARTPAAKAAAKVLAVDDGSYHALKRLAVHPDYTGRVEIAMWVGLAEERIELNQLVDPLVSGYYRWLDALGYQPGEDERHDLAKALGHSTTKAS